LNPHLLNTQGPVAWRSKSARWMAHAARDG
jgi:hypothetical protein